MSYIVWKTWWYQHFWWPPFPFIGNKTSTWWLIPVSKWDIIPVINGISRVNPLVIGVITHLLSGMNYQVYPWRFPRLGHRHSSIRPPRAHRRWVWHRRCSGSPRACAKRWCGPRSCRWALNGTRGRCWGKAKWENGKLKDIYIYMWR